MPFGAHWYDLAIVLLVAVLLFGSKRLPQIGASVGKTIREFKHSMKDVAAEVSAPETPALLPAASQPEAASAPQPAANAIERPAE